jgi:hypothetical protein
VEALLLLLLLLLHDARGRGVLASTKAQEGTVGACRDPHAPHKQELLCQLQPAAADSPPQILGELRVESSGQERPLAHCHHY